DRGRRVVLVRPLLAATVFLQPALLDADLGDEDDVVEILERCLVRGARLLATVALFDAACGFEDILEQAAIAARHLLLTGGCTLKQEIAPKFSSRVRAIENNEFALEHLGVAIRRPLEHLVFAHPAGADVHLHGGDGAVRNELGEVARVVGLLVVERHGGVLMLARGVERVYLRFVYGPSTTTNSQLRYSASPVFVRVSNPSSSALPGRMRICTVAVVPCG